MGDKLLIKFNACHAKFQNSDDFLEALGVDTSKYMFNSEDVYNIFSYSEVSERLFKGKNLVDLFDEDFCMDLLKKANLEEIVPFDGMGNTLASERFADFLFIHNNELCDIYDELGFALIDSGRFENMVYVVPLDISSIIFSGNWYNEKCFSTVNVYDLKNKTKMCSNVLCYTPEKIYDEHVDYVLERVGGEAESVLVEKNDYLTKHGFSFKNYKVLE